MPLARFSTPAGLAHPQSFGSSQGRAIAFDTAAHRARVTVAADSTTTLTKDGGLRLRLASRLAGWDLQLIQI